MQIPPLITLLWTSILRRYVPRLLVEKRALHVTLDRDASVEIDPIAIDRGVCSHGPSRPPGDKDMKTTKTALLLTADVLTEPVIADCASRLADWPELAMLLMIFGAIARKVAARL
jgi:hypothetical protein